MNPTYSHQGGSDLPALLDHPLITSLAFAKSCTPAQLVLKWGVQRGTSVIPKSVHPERIAENFDIDECGELAQDELESLLELPVKRFNNPEDDYGVPMFEGLEDAAVDAAEAVREEVKSWFGLGDW